MQPRTNPADSKNLVPLATSFTADYNTDSEDVSLSWSPITIDNADGEERHRYGYVIIRKTGSAPASVYDGAIVSDPFGSDAGAFTDGGAEAGYVNYYGLFAFWKEDGDSEGLSYNVEGIIQNTEGYVFSGPMVADADLTTITLPVAEDIYVTNADQTFDDDVLTIAVDAAYTPISVACVRFNVEAIRGATISSARLVLKNADSFMSASYSA